MFDRLRAAQPVDLLRDMAADHMFARLIWNESVRAELREFVERQMQGASSLLCSVCL